MANAFIKSDKSAGKSINSMKIDKELIESLERIPYSKHTKYEIPDYLIELYIKYIRVQHRDRKMVMEELNKRLSRPAGEKLWRNRVGEYTKLIDNK